MKPAYLVVIAAAVGALAGSLASYALITADSHSEDKLIAGFYLTENAVHVSPHSLRGKMDKGVAGYTLVDLRSAEEYAEEHIVGAVNIPAYKDRNTPAYEEQERILAAFRQLPQDRDIIVYCYSMPCMTGRKIGKMLAENGIYVKHLGIGWNEWRYQWTLWNHAHEWNTTNAEQYVASGPDPGTPNVTGQLGMCTIGEFGC
ncbi:MAG: rhodanese-like domain-containing protein [Candidatus Aenigmarchaeota archaeon]|nr:rhodanese-like domain-containing protein [Candidatus Aenigmarchaeota archaeon]